MRRITIKDITLLNFKGIHDLTIKFDPERTTISGANGAGKSTIFDAFVWLLFGKNSEDRKVFNIKTLDESGNAIPKIPHEVTATLDFNGEEVRLQRRFNEKWVKRRGTMEEVFDGHEEERLYNDVPMSVREWSEKIEAICDETVFKFITNPAYFCAQPAETQRNMIFKMAGDIADSEVAGDNQDFIKLLEGINGKTMEEYKREIAAKKSRIKEEMSGIPDRIEERQRDITEDIDKGKVQEKINETEAELAGISQAISDAGKAHQAAVAQYKEKSDSIAAKVREQYSLEAELIKEALKEYNAMAERQAELHVEYGKLSQGIAQSQEDIEANNAIIKNYEDTLTALREEWKEISARKLEIDDKEFICPTCKRPLEVEDIEAKKEDIIESFNAQKAKDLAANKDKGLSIKDKIAELAKKNETALVNIKANEEAIEKIKANPIFTISLTKPDVQPKIDSDPAHIAIVEEIARMQSELGEGVSNVDNTELLARQSGLQVARDELKKLLVKQEANEANKARIAELEESLKKLGEQFTKLEGIEDVMAKFGRAKAEMIESRVNGMFKTVKFKLFRQQVNGEYVETCEAMVNGVPFSDANKAGKLNAGLDIINAICRFNGVLAPIIIDNAESVNEVGETDSQMILLQVSRENGLKIEY